MTDTNEDRLDLEEAKTFRQELETVFNGSGVLDEDELFLILDALIDEVERLQDEHEQLLICWNGEAEWHVDKFKTLEEAFFKSAQTIAFLTKERDELLAYKKENDCYHSAYDQEREKVEELEAENAVLVEKHLKWLDRNVQQEDEITKLKQKLAELEDNKCPACHGAGFYKSDSVFRQTITKFQCKVCEGKGIAP